MATRRAAPARVAKPKVPPQGQLTPLALHGVTLPRPEVVAMALEMLRVDWPRHARPEQLLPTHRPWTYWLINAGRGWGKTRTGAETVRTWNAQGYQYVNLIGATADDARDIMIEGESGILACCPKHERPEYKTSSRKLVWPNGATSLIFTADEPERLRGKQHEKIWADELCAWRYAESWDQAKFGLRLGNNPQCAVTTTPKPTKLMRDLVADPDTVITVGTTYDNQANLAPSFFSSIIKAYEGTRLGRQELKAELLTDNPDALWTRDIIEASRVQAMPTGLVRVAVGVDPAVTAKKSSDETGIIVAGLASNGHAYVLADKSGKYKPNGWGLAAVTAYAEFAADRIVGEVNNGGDMVEHVIRTVSGQAASGVAYKSVTASRGKAVRAEPVSALYEQGRVHHVGSFPVLEDQMCEWNPTDDTAKSPDHMDALVWVLTDLFGISPGMNIFEYYKAEYEAQQADAAQALAQQALRAAGGDVARAANIIALGG